MIDQGFLGNIDNPFSSLTAAILCYSLRCWRTGDIIDNVAFMSANSRGKIYSTDSQQATGRQTGKQGIWNVRYRLGMIYPGSGRII